MESLNYYPDGLHLTVLKEVAPVITPVLAFIFQKSLNSSSVPEDWRVANVCPLFKNGDKSITTNYRPISKSNKKSRKKSKSKKEKKSEKLRRKSSRSPAHADPAVIYTTLVRKDGSESRIPFLFNSKSVCTFGTFKKRVLEACCPAHRVNAQLFHEQQT